MRHLLFALTTLLALSSTGSADDFLNRGHNPGHIFGNTVRRVYWGPGYASQKSSRYYSNR